MDNINKSNVYSYTPGLSGCGCGSRRYYTKAEIDAMLANVLDEDNIKEILDQMFEEYIEEGDLYELILNVIGDIYTKDEIDAMLAALDNKNLDTTAFTQFKNEMEECCNDVNGMIDYLLDKVSYLEEIISDITGSTPDTGDTPTPDTGDTPSSDRYVLVTYNVTSTTEPTKILSTIEEVARIETLNGDVIPKSEYYTFNSTGEQSLKFFTGNAAYQWYQLKQIVSATYNGTSPFFYEFAESSIKSVTAWIGGNCSFKNCRQLTTVNYGSGWGRPNGAVFCGCTALEQDFVIRDGSPSIEARAFKDSGIISLTIPASVSHIETDALKGCSKLQYIRFKGTTPPVLKNTNALGGTGYTFPIYVPASAVNTYKQELSDYASRIQAWNG